MTISKKLREEVFQRDNYTCSYCGTKLDNQTASIDQIVPASKGGTSDVFNLATACPTCNMRKGDKILGFFTTPVSERLARNWIIAFINTPKTAILGSIIGVFAAALILIHSYHRLVELAAKIDQQRLDSQSYEIQVTKLNATETQLKETGQKIQELLAFVSDQRDLLKKNEEAIAALKSERDALAPVVESQQKVIDALFAAQERRNEQALKKERWISFAIGVVAGVISTIIVAFFMYLIRFFYSKKLKNA